MNQRERNRVRVIRLAAKDRQREKTQTLPEKQSEKDRVLEGKSEREFEGKTERKEQVRKKVQKKESEKIKLFK